jgi:hypothetical protein
MGGIGWRLGDSGCRLSVTGGSCFQFSVQWKIIGSDGFGWARLDGPLCRAKPIIAAAHWATKSVLDVCLSFIFLPFLEFGSDAEKHCLSTIRKRFKFFWVGADKLRGWKGLSGGKRFKFGTCVAEAVRHPKRGQTITRVAFLPSHIPS